MADRALVIVPTYNERFNIARLIPAVLAQDPSLEVLVVDDGSPDGTGGIVDAIAANNDRVHVIHREGKLGLGTAYIAGFRWALARKYDIVFEMDADFSHNPERLPEFLEAIKEADLLASYPFYPATLGELEFRRGKYKTARQHFAEALALARNPMERRFLDQRVRACDGGDTQ